MLQIFRLRYWLSLLGFVGIRTGTRLTTGSLSSLGSNMTRSQMIKHAIGASTAAGIGATAGTVYNHISDLDERARAAARDIARTCAANIAICGGCSAQNGVTVARPRPSMSLRAREYQQYISLFPQGVEWRYNGVDFDGFHPLRCTLVEAKDRHTHLLCSFRYIDDPLVLRADFQPWSISSALPSLKDEAIRQLAAAIPRPPVSLEWHFSEAITAVVVGSHFSFDGILIAIQYTKHPTADGTTLRQLKSCKNVTITA